MGFISNPFISFPVDAGFPASYIWHEDFNRAEIISGTSFGAVTPLVGDPAYIALTGVTSVTHHAGDAFTGFPAHLTYDTDCIRHTGGYFDLIVAWTLGSVPGFRRIRRSDFMFTSGSSYVLGVSTRSTSISAGSAYNTDFINASFHTSTGLMAIRLGFNGTTFTSQIHPHGAVALGDVVEFDVTDDVGNTNNISFTLSINGTPHTISTTVANLSTETHFGIYDVGAASEVDSITVENA